MFQPRFFPRCGSTQRPCALPLPTLQYIPLIGSPGSGSFASLEQCAAILQPYAPSAQILPKKEPVDFEDVNALVHCLRDIIHKEKHDRGMQERDIIIDVTGASITASATWSR